MTTKRIPTLVWGTVSTNGHRYFLLEPAPEKSRYVWKPEGMLCWQVTEVGSSKSIRNFDVEVGDEGDYTYVYKASYLVFGKDAVIELLDDPTKVILVDYFSSDDDDNDDTANAGN